MYVDGFIERKKGYEIFHVAERVNSQRVLKQYNPVYEYYVESLRGTQKTIRGTMAEKYEFNTRSEMNKSLEKHKDLNIFESDRNVVFKSLSRYYPERQSPDLHIAFFDIETDFHEKKGYASTDNPFNRVTAISLYQTWTDCDYVLSLAPKDMPHSTAVQLVKELNEEINDPNSRIILYTDEKEMFEDFFELIEDADVLSGWNSEFYDIPYLVNRTKKLFSDAMTTRFCLWGQKPKVKEADNYGKTVFTYDLIGRVHLDYLALYKKHAGQVEQSYKLDDIAEKVVGENKVSYDGSLQKLYETDYKKWLKYSRQDSILLKKINLKLDYISLHNRLAHNECVLIATTMGSVALIDTAIVNLAHSRGVVVFNKVREEEADEEEVLVDEDGEEVEASNEKCTAKAAGAWVQDPVLGLVDFIGCTDFNSLYPTVLRTLGMSTELIIGQVRQDYTMKYLNDKIEEQRSKSRSKKFEPDWTAAWHGLFAAVEFTMIHNKTNDILTVDFENGESFNCTAAELYDTIFAPDSTIVISSNGTLFDKSTEGIIPEILTKWYSERKSQQKMVIDFKHLYTDGWEIISPDSTDIAEFGEMVKSFGYGNNTSMHRSNIHTECPVFQLRQIKDKTELAKFIATSGLEYDFETAKLHCSAQDKQYCKDQSAFWKQNQQIRKILLNSLYGSLLNVSSLWFDRRLGQSVTLTGRTMTKHMASTINKICTGEYSHEGGVVIYGDTDSVYFSVAHYMKNMNQEFNLTKDEVIDMYRIIGDQTGETFPEFMDKSFNTGIEKGKIVGADLEMVGSRGLFLKKKRYAILKYWEDGFRLDETGNGKIKAMGIEIKRSDTPKYIQKFLEDTLIALLVGENEEQLRTRVRDFKKIFKDKPSYDKGSPKTVKNYSNLQLKYEETGKCSVGHVLSAINWNKLRKIYEDNTVPEATDGTKVIVCMLKTNPMQMKSVGFPIDCLEYLPEWFLDLPFDDESMEKAVLTKKLNNIFGILDMDMAIDEKSTLELDSGFFDW